MRPDLRSEQPGAQCGDAVDCGVEGGGVELAVAERGGQRGGGRLSLGEVLGGAQDEVHARVGGGDGLWAGGAERVERAGMTFKASMALILGRWLARRRRSFHVCSPGTRTARRSQGPSRRPSPSRGQPSGGGSGT